MNSANLSASLFSFYIFIMPLFQGIRFYIKPLRKTHVILVRSEFKKRTKRKRRKKKRKKKEKRKKFEKKQGKKESTLDAD